MVLSPYLKKELEKKIYVYSYIEFESEEHKQEEYKFGKANLALFEIPLFPGLVEILNESKNFEKMQDYVEYADKKFRERPRIYVFPHNFKLIFKYKSLWDKIYPISIIIPKYQKMIIKLKKKYNVSDIFKTDLRECPELFNVLNIERYYMSKAMVLNSIKFIEKYDPKVCKIMVGEPHRKFITHFLRYVYPYRYIVSKTLIEDYRLLGKYRGEALIEKDGILYLIEDEDYENLFLKDIEKAEKDKNFLKILDYLRKPYLKKFEF